MNFFKREAKAAIAMKDEVFAVGDEIAAAIDHELKTFELGILDRSANAIDDVLDKAKTERDRLGAEIVTLQAKASAALKDFEEKIAANAESLRQSNVVIAAFEATQAALVAGSDPQSAAATLPPDAAPPVSAEPAPMPADEATAQTVAAALIPEAQ